MNPRDEQDFRLEHVADAGQQGDDHAPHHRLLPHDDPADFALDQAGRLPQIGDELRTAFGRNRRVMSFGEFYALSVVFGLAYGGVMPLYAVLVREYFGAKIMGTVFGVIIIPGLYFIFGHLAHYERFLRIGTVIRREPLSEELAPFHPAAPHPEPAEPAAHIDAVVVQIAAVVVPAEAVLVTREAPEAKIGRAHV